MHKPLYITGIGAVSPAGVGVDALYQRILTEQSTIAPSPGWGYHVGALGSSDRDRLMQAAPENLARLAGSFPDAPLLLGHALTIQAMSEAMLQARWQSLDSATDGIIFATTTGQIPFWENDLMKFMTGQGHAEELAISLRQQALGQGFKQVCQSWNFNGPVQNVVSACAASTQAVHLAELWLRCGKVKRCLVGGAELLCHLVLRGFDAFQLLAPEIAAPFDAARKGINLAEGAGFICLESEPTATPFAELSGSGISLDAYHMTAPQPEGEGIFAAMTKALDAANLTPADISWVYAHGTGSPHNDSAEGKAVQRLFGDRQPYVSSTKAVHGHALAATGILEMIMAVKALGEQRVLSTVNLKAPDPAIAVKHPAGHPFMPVEHILKTTLGFGGSNAAAILSRVNL